MSTKKKILIAVLGVEAVVIAAVIGFLFYINSDTVKVHRQLELAQRYLLEEEYEEAIAAFEAVIEIDPKNAEAYLGLAEAYEATDDIENVVKILERGAKRTDSEKIQELLKEHTEELEKRELAAQRAADAAQEAADASQTNSAETTEEASSAQVIAGFVTQNGEIYYYDAQGNLVTGWFDENSNRYCARDDGRLYKDGEYEIESVQYAFDPNGICLGEIVDDAWKQAYIDYIKQKHKEFCSQYQYDNQYQYGIQDMDMYGLIDIDNDDIPELAVMPTQAVQITPAYIASYSNGKVYCDSGCFVQSYIERGNLFYALKHPDDISATVQIWHIQDGRQTVIAEGYYSQEYENEYYEWNNVQMTTWKDFEEEISKVYSGEKEIWNGIQYTYEEILDKVVNY